MRGRVLLATAAVLVASALAALLDGYLSLVVLCAPAAGWCGMRAWSWFGLAENARVGAASEARVIDQLEPLRRDGWELEYNVPLPGNGDIDVVAIAPGCAPRLMVAIEIKTSGYSTRHLRRTVHAAATLAGDGPRAAVLVTVASRETAVRYGVSICSAQRLVGVLRSLARDHTETSASRSRRPAQRRFDTGHRRAAHARGPAGYRTGQGRPG